MDCNVNATVAHGTPFKTMASSRLTPQLFGCEVYMGAPHLPSTYLCGAVCWWVELLCRNDVECEV